MAEARRWFRVVEHLSGPIDSELVEEHSEGLRYVLAPNRETAVARAGSPIAARLNEIEKRLSKDPTFSNEDRKLILKSDLPAWLVYAARQPGPQRERSQKAVDALVKLRGDVVLPEAFGAVKDD